MVESTSVHLENDESVDDLHEAEENFVILKISAKGNISKYVVPSF